MEEAGPSAVISNVQQSTVLGVLLWPVGISKGLSHAEGAQQEETASRAAGRLYYNPGLAMWF